MPPWQSPMLLWPLSALVVVVLVSIATIAVTAAMLARPARSHEPGEELRQVREDCQCAAAHQVAVAVTAWGWC